MAAIKIRCSRPLCSSQTTTRTTPTTPPPREAPRRGRNQDSGAPRRDPTRNNHPHPARITPPLAGNGRSCCPRTQQCANTPTPIRTRRRSPSPRRRDTPATAEAPIPDAVLREPTGRYDHGARFVDVPPLSNPPVHTRDRHGQPMDHPGTRIQTPGR
jgi:hypothetical protein